MKNQPASPSCSTPCSRPARLLLLLPLLLAAACGLRVQEDNAGNQSAEAATGQQEWVLGPFEKLDAANPVLGPLPTSTFFCPVRGEEVQWEEKDVFNPAAVVRDGKVYLLYRAEDSVGRYNGTSRIGLAISEDGISFSRQPKPVLYPENDFMKKYEWEGGIEDPRVVETEDGLYMLTYSAYDGQIARLCVASSPDLQNWEKHGLAFGKARNGKHENLWSKAGSIVSRREGSRQLATRINGKYWMYWGDTDIFLASSDNLIDWTPVENPDGNMLAVFGPRPNSFDSRLVEAGPPALLTDKGILLIYNSMNLPHREGGTPDLPEGTYTAGQALMKADNPAQLIARTDTYFLRPEREYEITGQVGNVVFLEGLAFHNSKWFLYYGTADSKIAVARH
jgi:predicted GH43/DUF377 family glycosyl hydrolase